MQPCIKSANLFCELQSGRNLYLCLHIFLAQPEWGKLKTCERVLYFIIPDWLETLLIFIGFYRPFKASIQLGGAHTHPPSHNTSPEQPIFLQFFLVLNNLKKTLRRNFRLILLCLERWCHWIKICWLKICFWFTIWGEERCSFYVHLLSCVINGP